MSNDVSEEVKSEVINSSPSTSEACKEESSEVLEEKTKDEPLHINIATSKGQSRKRLRTKGLNAIALPEAAQDAQKKEKERLERLEKLRQGAPTAESYQPVMQVATDEESDDCLIDCVIPKKKQQVEIVDLSSDEEEFQKNGSMQSKMYRVHQEEQARTRRLRRKSGTLDKLEYTKEGLLLVNEGKPAGDPDVFVAAHLTKILQPHQLGGVRFMYDNIIESIKNYDPNNGFGCILAHSMGLGKTLQVITFVDIFFRVTKRKKALIICPVNVLQNWYNEFDKWLPMDEGKRQFSVFIVGDAAKTIDQRYRVISQWDKQGGVILVGYEMFKLLTQPKKNENSSMYEYTQQEKMNELCERALVDPGPDLVICDEGHRIKNLKTACAAALNRIKTKRRVVLTGYPLQNNLMEYYCMVDFVRPSYLGDRKNFSQNFDKPIKNGSCIDSTPYERKEARKRTHVLIQQLKGFVQRRTQHILKKILPESREYVVMLRKTDIQKSLYKKFLLFVKSQLDVKDSCFYNPLKAYAICSKIWNHPDLLHDAWKEQLALATNEPKPAPQTPFYSEPSTSYDPNSFGSMITKFTDVPFESGAPGKKSRKKKKAVSSIDDDDNSIPYYWADDVMASYDEHKIINSYKMLIALTIIESTVIRGEKILLFSGSLKTLSLIEEFLKMRGDVSTVHGNRPWKRNETYFRFDGSTSSTDREKLIDRFNSDPGVHLFLISTKAGSLGVNLVSATRVIIFDASWNPCHDAQAVCRIYRYGQQKKTFIYRLVTHNSMERAIFARQISKNGLQQRVVDEQHIDAKVTTKELENLIAYDESLDFDSEHKDVATWKEKIDDDLLRDIAMFDSKIFAECPFLHDSLLLEGEEALSPEERLEAEMLYEKERAKFNSQGSSKNDGLNRIPTYLPSMYNQSMPFMGQRPITVGQMINNMNYNNQPFNPQQRFDMPRYTAAPPGPMSRDLMMNSDSNAQYPYNNQYRPPYPKYNNMPGSPQQPNTVPFFNNSYNGNQSAYSSSGSQNSFNGNGNQSSYNGNQNSYSNNGMNGMPVGEYNGSSVNDYNNTHNNGYNSTSNDGYNGTPTTNYSNGNNYVQNGAQNEYANVVNSDGGQNSNGGMDYGNNGDTNSGDGVTGLNGNGTGGQRQHNGQNGNGNNGKEQQQQRSQNRIISKNVRAHVKEDIALPSIGKADSTVYLKKGDPILIVHSVNGGVYIRTATGQIADAANTSYANDEQVIDLD
ncbi:unnamed protein product [Bursaphelenchus okinawaensis]|uniref:Uncharacterized protein n=1 Tax=Bursaphelenchus okinawaensis TaxID=465554 RepID=A0A811KZZ2_9BILA|nr:unnamed protein product [Bursaphelenchus okinawaensis]CAG9113719.1 unnamed protein product [Bursaphelenchus okinawaensis]